jgi:hypothetical protein
MAEAAHRLGLAEADYTHVAEELGLLTVDEWLENEDALAPSSEIATTVRRGQFWCTPSEMANGQVLEVLGFADGMVDVAVWSCLSGHMVVVGSPPTTGSHRSGW